MKQTQEQIEQSNNRLKCSICITHDVNYVLTPCGHTICEECMNRWHGAGCPTCRTRITAKVKFYLPAGPSGGSTSTSSS